VLTYVGQATLNPFLGPHLRVEVRLTTINGANAIAYVYPQYGRLSNKVRLIPIVFSSSTPRKVYYDGPGGDYYNPASPVPFYPVTGIILILTGLYFIVSVIISRRRILLLFSQRPCSQRVPKPGTRWQTGRFAHVDRDMPVASRQDVQRVLAQMRADLAGRGSQEWENPTLDRFLDALERRRRERKIAGRRTSPQARVSEMLRGTRRCPEGAGRGALACSPPSLAVRHAQRSRMCW
jgi:hypothetical protein